MTKARTIAGRRAAAARLFLRKIKNQPTRIAPTLGAPLPLPPIRPRPPNPSRRASPPGRRARPQKGDGFKVKPRDVKTKA